MKDCCTPYLYAWWSRSAVSVFQRHSGPTCAGQMEELDFDLWYSTGERRIVR